MVIIAPNTKASTAVLLAERLRLTVESAALLPADAGAADAPARVTVSIGVAELGEHARDVAALLASADKAVYRAKREGRNRVIVSGPPDPVFSVQPA